MLEAIIESNGMTYVYHLKELEMIDEYTFLDVDCEDRVITVFCRDTQIDHAKTAADLSANKWHLTEYDDTFDNNIDQENKFKGGTDFWWDISNHFDVLDKE